jgi:Kef-type K+ transport system membrane component KefB/mannitol/fructose-specific phosphotransferase system IIA component (Ntr-type)
MLTVTDPIIFFAVLMLGILIAPVISIRLHIPDLIILLFFGALLGPNGLHVLERNEAVKLLGSVGLLYIMFLAGIEIDLYRFSKSYKRSILLGLFTFLIPQSLGALVAHYFLKMNWASSILLASMLASHTLLAYPLASKLGISRQEPVAITVGATIITDTLALLVLAVIADSARGISLGFGLFATIFVGMLALTILIWKVVPAVTRWFFNQVSEESNTQFLFVIVILCFFAYLSHLARMEPIIGAFLVGAAFNRLIPQNSTLMNRVTFAGNTLFIPIFLISVGMLVDTGSMISGTRSWLIGAAMVLSVVVTKYLAAQLARWLFGYSQAAGNVIFGLSVVQAAATLAAVMVGYELNIFDESVLNGTIMMILATCLLGSWMVDRYGRKMAAQQTATQISTSRDQRLLVLVEKTKTAIPLLDLSFLLYNDSLEANIFPLTIVTNDDNVDEAVTRGENLLGHCLAHAASADIPVFPGLRVEVNLADGIVHAALELHPSTVIIRLPAHKSSHIRIFGSLTNRLVEKCPSRLLFCQLVKPLATAKRLLLPLPELATYRRDIQYLINDAKMLAHRSGAQLSVHIFDDHSEHLESLIKKSKPDCPVNFTLIGSDKSLQKYLLENIKADDTILLPSDRKNGIMWSPKLDHLPQMILDRFPDTNLLIDYPSIPRSDSQYISEIPLKENRLPPVVPVNLTAGYTLDMALKHLADIAFPHDQIFAQAAAQKLSDAAESYPVELLPNVMLIHTRCDKFYKELLMICHTPDSIQITGMNNPVNIILVLLGAKSQSPQEHLKTLSLIAAKIIKIAQENKLDQTQNAEQICSLIQKEDELPVS